MGVWKKIWKFLWESNSIWSWIASLAIVFILIIGIFFPLMRLTFSTSLPLVVIESQSMAHKYSYDEWYSNCSWYQDHNISKEEFKQWSFHNGLYMGDIILVKGEKEYKKGDVIIFQTQQTTPIIHRKVLENPTSTKGDNNCYQLSQEKEISQDKIIGKAVLRIPWLGWAKLIFVEIGKVLISIFQ